MSRGLDNNNPGNLKKVASHFFVGEKRKSTDDTFRQFYEMAFGYRAMLRQLQYYREYGWNTIRIIITHWSGETKEIVDPYVEFVSKAIGILADEPLTLKDKTQLMAIVDAISAYENGVPAVPDDVMDGYNLLYDTKMQ